MRKFDYSSDLPASKSQTFMVADRIDVSQFKEVVLCCRLHSWGSGQSSHKIQFDLLFDGHTDEDPTLIFQKASGASSITFTQGINLPGTMDTIVAYSYNGIPNFITVKVTLIQGTPAGAYSTTVSADIILRD
jgi:hypothetical protein